MSISSYVFNALYDFSGILSPPKPYTMRRLLFFSLLASIFFTSCSRHYVCYNDLPLPVYTDESLSSQSYVIPSSQPFAVSSKARKVRKVTFNRATGYLSRYYPFRSKRRVSKRFYERFVINNVYVAPTTVANKSASTSPSVSMPRSSSSSHTPGSGTVNVKGYYRKDGTYVRPHTRSAPKRR